jgi:uncharacterized protein YwgA
MNKTDDKVSTMKSVLKTVGLDLGIDNFGGRLKTQKVIYLLHLNPEFRKQLPYGYSMYLHGPYSPELASVYYNSSKTIRATKTIRAKKVKVSFKSLEYGKKIASLSNRELELIATLNETMRVNKGKIRPNEAIELVCDIKPQFNKSEVSRAFEHLKTLKTNYGLDL